jgi:hypothetical protein
MVKSSTGYNNFTIITPTASTNKEILALEYNNTYDYWVGGGRGGIVRSFDGTPIDGNSWTLVNSSITGLVGVKWNGNIWVGFSSNTYNVCTSTDGNTWTNNINTAFTLSPTGDWGHDIDFANGKWIIGGSKGTNGNSMFYSLDNANTWLSVTNSGVFQPNCNSVRYITETSTWISCGDNGIWSSKDNGNTWSKSTNGPTSPYCVTYM